jgi:hypothetical protein
MFTKTRLLAAIFVGSLLVLAFQFAIAQTDSSIELTGTVEAVGEGTITVNGLVVDISNITEGDPVAVGDMVTIEGTLEGGVVIAVEVKLEMAEPESTPEATAEPDDDGEDLDEDNDLDVVIVILGPVVGINDNVITIYNFDIELDPEDPVLTVIQVGDVIRVEGGIAEEGDTIVIIAINIIFINVDVVINGDEIWRDMGNCQNPPPPWAPANGWRRRCEPGGNGSSGSHS